MDTAYMHVCVRPVETAYETEAPPALHESDFKTKTPMQVSAQRARRHAPLQGLARTANDNLMLESASEPDILGSHPSVTTTRLGQLGGTLFTFTMPSHAFNTTFLLLLLLRLLLCYCSAIYGTHWRGGSTTRLSFFLVSERVDFVPVLA